VADRMPATVRQENLRPLVTQASLILESEGMVANAQRGGRSTDLVTPKEEL
jgi:hypothetical protein